MGRCQQALDGTKAGTPRVEPYMELESGALGGSVLSDIADAIRGQNGESTQYQPGDMTAAILALTWDTGLKIRAMLLSDGTLELNYRNGRSSDNGTIVKCWEVDSAGYSSAAARPWDEDRQSVTRVVFDSDFSGAGMTNLSYFCHSMMRLVEVSGFEELSGCTNVSHMFTSCSSWRRSGPRRSTPRRSRARPTPSTGACGSRARRAMCPPTPPASPRSPSARPAC